MYMYKLRNVKGVAYKDTQHKTKIQFKVNGQVFTEYSESNNTIAKEKDVNNGKDNIRPKASKAKKVRATEANKKVQAIAANLADKGLFLDAKKRKKAYYKAKHKGM